LGFEKAKLVSNNLLGQGPEKGAQEMRYQNVGTFGGKSLDLVVTVKSPSYVMNNVRVNNGLLCANLNQGKYGTGHEVATKGTCGSGQIAHYAQINLKSGPKKGQVVDFKYEIQYTATKKAVKLPGFYMSFYDIDQNKVTGKEKGPSFVQEKLKVSGFSKAVYDTKSSEVIFKKSGNSVTAESKSRGFGCDNPHNPMELKAGICNKNKYDQKKRSVMLTYKDTSSFDVQFETIHMGGAKDGRNFIFGFKSGVVSEC